MQRTILFLLIHCSAGLLLTASCARGDWRKDPLRYMVGNWVEEIAVEGLQRGGVIVGKSDSTRFSWDAKWKAVAFTTSCTYGSDRFSTTTETYRVSVRHNQGNEYYFYFIPRDGPTFPIRRLPLTFSPSSGFRGRGEAEAQRSIPVEVSIVFERSGAHVWSIIYDPRNRSPLAFKFRFSKFGSDAGAPASVSDKDFEAMVRALAERGAIGVPGLAPDANDPRTLIHQENTKRERHSFTTEAFTVGPMWAVSWVAGPASEKDIGFFVVELLGAADERTSSELVHEQWGNALPAMLAAKSDFVRVSQGGRFRLKITANLPYALDVRRSR